MEDYRRSTTTIASSTTVLIMSIKLNCFIKQAGLFNIHPTFNRNYPASVDNGDGWPGEEADPCVGSMQRGRTRPEWEDCP